MSGSITDSTCQSGNCQNDASYDYMLSNIFTCKRTNPSSSPSESLEIPPFGVIGDDDYYQTKSSDSAEHDTINSQDYSLEYPGRGWTHKNTVDKRYGGIWSRNRKF